MQTLLDKANINEPKLEAYIHKIVAHELSKMVTACYYPSMKKYYFELLYLCGLEEKDLKDFTKNFYKETKYKTFKLQSDHITNFYIFIYWYFAKQRKNKTAESCMFLFLIRYYSNLMTKYIKFCDPKTFKLALEKISKTHLFVREESIGQSLIYLARQLIIRYNTKILNQNPNDIGLFITESRHRVEQSVKSFCVIYYKLKETGEKITEPFETDEGQVIDIDKKELLIGQIVQNITVYKMVDPKALNIAKTQSGIQMSLATELAKELTNMKYLDNLKTIYRVFIQDVKDVNMLCGYEYFVYVKKLLSIKRTNQKIYFKKECNDLLIDCLKNLKLYDSYETQSNQTKFNYLSFLAYYVTCVLRNTVCSV